MKTWIRVVKNLLHVVRQITTNTQTVVPGRLSDSRLITIEIHPDSGAKSTARSKANRDLDSDTKSTARSKANYDRNPESGTKLTARSKENYDRDPESGTK